MVRPGRGLFLVPAAHCQLPALLAMSPSVSNAKKCWYPSRQSICTMRVRNCAVIRRARLCM
jgi:hypothetical protein